MSNLQIAMLVFALFDAVRIAGFLMQMSSIVRDRNGATAISCWSWAIFAATHASNGIYSATIAQDWRLTAVFAINGACCLIIILLTFIKRRRYRAGAPEPRSRMSYAAGDLQ